MGTDLRPFLPRGSMRWLRDEPGTRHRRIDASLVFVDISGFTAMSERLARLGRVGAEEVTDLLNQTFGPLLAVAYDDDGSLLKFGGDALLLQFTGCEHEVRAVHAAVGMRRALRDLQPLSSSAGQVHLRMTVGVHSGPIDQFLVGSDHRELLLLGPGASAVVRTEGAAGAGEIMLSQGVVDRLGDAVEAVPVPGGFRLRSNVAAPSERAAADHRAEGDAAAGELLAPVLRQHLAAGTPPAEHRHCVIAFVKFTGTDRLLAGSGPAATAERVGELIDQIDQAAASGGVCLLSSDVDADGGKLILTAGVPTAAEFDGERMLRALRRVVESRPPLDLRIGVHAGPVFAGVVGPPFRTTYTIIGDAVNLAARVMGHAEPGTILATPDVLNRSQALFETRPVPAFEVKGKAQRVEAMTVGPVTAGRRRRAPAPFRLAGRREELRVLVEEAAAASDGRGRIVQVLGPAGLGKSRLVDELHERRPETDLRVFACNRYEATTPYHTAAQLVRDVLGLRPASRPRSLVEAVVQHAPQLESSLPLLGDVVGLPVPDNESTRDLAPRFRAERAAAAAVEVLNVLLPDPAVIVIEDVHWIDPESSRVLSALAQSVLSRRAWLLVLTARRQVVLDTTADLDETLITLEPLGEAESRELVLAAAQEGLVTLDRAQQLLDLAGGNPFFLQSLLTRGHDEQELPADIDALLQADLDRLPHHDRELLGLAAILGEEVEPQLFEAMTGLDASRQQEAWERLGDFVEPTAAGQVRFRHALVHDVAYGRLPFQRRRDLHRRVAVVLQQRLGDDRPDLLALHTYHAGEWEKARAYAIEAGRQAAARYANLTAAEQYRRAVAAGRYVRGLSDEEVAEVWERLGDMLLLGSSYDEAVAAYRKARQLVGPGRQVRLGGQIGQIRERQGRYREALAWLTRARNLDEVTGSGETPRLLVEAAIVRIRQGRPVDAVELAERAAAQGGDVHVQARVAYVRGWAAMMLGQDGSAHQRRTLELFRGDGDLVGEGLAYNLISMAAYHRGDWDEAAIAYERARDLRRRVGDEVAAAVANGNLGELLADQGHFDRARPLLEEARAVCAAAGFPGQHFAMMTLGRLAARQGRFDEARQQLEEARDRFTQLQLEEFVPQSHAYLAECALFRGDLTIAEAAADELAGWTGAGSGRAATTAERLRLCARLERGDVASALTAAKRLQGALDADDESYDAALGLAAVAAALTAAGETGSTAVRARADRLLARLGVVVPAELFLFGPRSSYLSSK